MKSRKFFGFLLLCSFFLSGVVSAPVFAKEKRVFFRTPKNGAKVPTEFEVRFGLSKTWRVEPAGKIVPGTGHHHLIVNGNFIEKGKVVPADEKHIHFGNAATRTKITLPPGRHQLTLQFADGAHVSYGERFSETITVFVEPKAD